MRSSGRAARDRLVDAARRSIAVLAPLHRPLDAPEPDAWRAVERDEPSEPFEDFARAWRRRRRRPAVEVHPLGPFSPSRTSSLDAAVAFLRASLGIEVRSVAAVDLPRPPRHRRRPAPDDADATQVHTGWLTRDVLPTPRSRGVTVIVGVTAADLWPGGAWNYLAGEADQELAIAVCSLHRLGDPGRGARAFRAHLRRTAKLLLHETAHLLALEHCRSVPCALQGSNSRAEADRWPLWLCPECAAKVALIGERTPTARLRALRKLCEEQSLKQEERFLTRSLHQLGI